jgi:arsenate reductase
MKLHKAYTLSTCDTSKKILKAANISSDRFEIKDIKADAIELAELEEMRRLAGSYEVLFSRRAQKYKSMGLKDKKLSEDDYKNLILQEYTFLKRPVVIIDEEIFIGNSKKNVDALISKVLK